MRTHLFCAIAAAALFGASQPALADSCLRPKVDFSAKIVASVQGSEPVSMGTMYHGGGKVRVEQAMTAFTIATVFDYSKRTAVIIWDTAKVYALVPDIDRARMDGPGIWRRCKFKAVSRDKIDGHATTKYRVLNPKEMAFKGHVWMTKDDIPIRYSGQDVSRPGAKVPKGEKPPSFMHGLTELRLSKQSRKLFETPKGYRKVTMVELMKLMSSAPPAN